jgi:hypothetical protein
MRRKCVPWIPCITNGVVQTSAVRGDLVGEKTRYGG